MGRLLLAAFAGFAFILICGGILWIGVMLHRQGARYDAFYGNGSGQIAEVAAQAAAAQVTADKAAERAEWAATMRLSREALRHWFVDNCGGPPPNFDKADQ